LLVVALSGVTPGTGLLVVSLLGDVIQWWHKARQLNILLAPIPSVTLAVWLPTAEENFWDLLGEPTEANMDWEPTKDNMHREPMPLEHEVTLPR
jgi:hypothetical protein